jgi:hypothetical protein
MKKLIGYAVVIMVVLGISSEPDQWADVASAAGSKAVEIATGIGEFLHELFT